MTLIKLVQYIGWYYYRKVWLLIINLGKDKVEQNINNAIFSKHPMDFRQDLDSWNILRKQSPDVLNFILTDNLHYCECHCDNIGSTDPKTDCIGCYLMPLKTFFDKWYKEKSNLIGRFN